MVISGTDGFKQNLRVVNSRDEISKNYVAGEGKYTQVNFLRSNRNKVACFAVGSEKGSIQLFNYPFNPADGPMDEL